MTTKPILPKDHLAAMQVPKGGSMCANCRFLKDDGKNCGAENFIAWEGPDKPAGSSLIPLPTDEYCSDWYEPKKDAIRSIKDMINRMIQIIRSL